LSPQQTEDAGVESRVWLLVGAFLVRLRMPVLLHLPTICLWVVIAVGTALQGPSVAGMVEGNLAWRE